MAQEADEKEIDFSKYFTAKPLFGDPNDFGVLINNSSVKKKKANIIPCGITDEKEPDDESEDEESDDEKAEACIIDDQGHVTNDNYTLNKDDFKDWSINKIIKKSNIAKHIQNKNKKFNEASDFWKFIKNKGDQGILNYAHCVEVAKQKNKNLQTKHANLVQNMSFDDIAAISLYTTSEFYKPLNKSLRNRSEEWAPFCGPLLAGLNKLPFVWQTLYRGTKSKTVKKRITESYKPGAIVRWDSFTSTSTEINVAQGGFFCGENGTVFIIENGFRGRDIELFSVIPGEKEILFSVSSHFMITSIDNSQKITRVTLKELPFPWDTNTILWVDDRPTNNKGIMQEFEANGAMVIPRISTYGAKEFLDFTKNAINLNTFSKFRVITDMYRREYPLDDTSKQFVKDKCAGVTLIEVLRQVGYKNKVCIYTGSGKEEPATNKCKERNVYDDRVIITDSPNKVRAFGSFKPDK